MEQVREISMRKQGIALMQFSLFLVLLITAPFIKNQLITGSIVNALLFISVIVFGLRKSFLLAMLPSLASLSIGFLPLVLAPMIPFIILGNIVLMAVFSIFKEKNLLLAVVFASVLKFMVLILGSGMIFNQLVAYKMISSIQLLTALAGGLIAFAYYKLNRKNYDF